MSRRLPGSFDRLLRRASVDELKAVFDTRPLDARGGQTKAAAIGFPDCPDELIVWLVERGLDVDTTDEHGATPLWERAAAGRTEQIPLLLSLGADIRRQRRRGGTPLHAAAAHQRPDATRLLLEHGADVHAVDDAGETPLLRALKRTPNAGIPGMARVAELLLDAGSAVTPEMPEAVERITRNFEFHRPGFSAALLPKADTGLRELHRFFGATPVQARMLHDGTAPITIPSGTWQDRHQVFWELLVPANGAARTVQGEVIRITGRVAREILDNRSRSWDRDFRSMLGALPAHLGSGAPLPEDRLAEALRLSSALRSGHGSEQQVYRLSELAVAWVCANPEPLPLHATGYAR
ncbi:ankyrin repeat domain-containing protein [Leucobacter sp.]